MKILVTGGAGYIGSHTVLELVAAEHTPVIVDNFSNSERGVLKVLNELAGQEIKFYEADCNDSNKLNEILASENPEALVHFAAFKAVGESVTDPLKYYRNNVAGFENVLECAVSNGVKHLVFSSTAAVYGNPPAEQVTEQTPVNPESPYGWSKYMDEIILRDSCAANKNLHGVALRYFNVVGAHESGRLGESPLGKPQNLLPIIVQAVAGKIPPLTVYGTDYPTPDGTCQRDYIHVTDLAKAHVKALEKIAKDQDGGFSIYNVSTGKPTSVLELIKTFEEVNSVKVPHQLGERRPGDPTAYYATAEKAKAELGWQASKTIEDAVRDAWRWQTKSSGKYN